ncbi:SDR family NAD(P)-dependent oxidoreductase [Polymorphospora rubra]|uniref:Short-chain dehydrogenase n=1 Tax=Polymorphospora rubra TaxID=338584 RepID=A0A810N7F8_9ACTN|nr:SDR family NAD(P)-dependent oxidoreductase [Polymorphospora rubra]BCJ67718.1 short-chain dehydrogenase [Polymorphospora rubra]
MAGQLDGRRIIVTGGAQGIGAAVVAGYVAEGARVAALDRQFGTAGTTPDNIVRRHCDVADRAGVTTVFDEVVGLLGGLDVLVNVAGVERGGPSDDIPDADWDAVFDVNAKGTRNTNAAAFTHLKANGGAIINFGSRSGIVGVPQQAAYSASKAAVHVWTRAVAQEWAPYNITVNAVAPAMWTGMYDDYRGRLNAEELAQHDAMMSAQIPIGGKLGEPTRDLVPLLVFLAGDGAHFISGQSFPVDGGWLHMR